METKPLTPKLRFPEFREAGNWEEVQLNQFASFVNDRVGDADCVPYTVTSGIGLVSQVKKFGRTIAGNSLGSYVRLVPNDFAYNKSSTKSYPEGYIARFRDDVKAAVPKSIFTCFRVDFSKVEPAYLDYLFAANLHGRWLRNFLTVGARAHGSLNVNDSDLMALPVPLPAGEHSQAEQQKIAECLTSLDELIAAEGRKLEALRTYKKGLMQNLFPREGETTPRLRFPEFRDAPEWRDSRMSDHVDLVSGMHLLPNQYAQQGEIPYFAGPSDYTNYPAAVTKRTRITPNVGVRHDTLITVKGSGVGELWRLELPLVAIGRQLMAVRARALPSGYIYQFLLTKRTRFQNLAAGNLIPGLSRKDILDLIAPMPSPTEGKRIADCLTSLDALITAQVKKLDTLKRHKQGLMQGLFPSLDEVTA